MAAAGTGDFLYSFHDTETVSQTFTDQYTLNEHFRESVADLAQVSGVLTLRPRCCCCCDR